MPARQNYAPEVSSYLSQYESTSINKRFLKRQTDLHLSAISASIKTPFIGLNENRVSHGSEASTWLLDRKLELEVWLGRSDRERQDLNKKLIISLLAVIVVLGLAFTEFVRSSNPECTKSMLIKMPVIKKADPQLEAGQTEDTKQNDRTQSLTKSSQCSKESSERAEDDTENSAGTDENRPVPDLYQ